MRMLVLGAGLQGSSCAYDLLQSPDVTEVRLADLTVGQLPAFLAPYTDPAAYARTDRPPAPLGFRVLARLAYALCEAARRNAAACPDDFQAQRAAAALDYLALGWHVVRGRHEQSRNVRYLHAERVISISTDRPLPVQADGEIIGETPVEVQVVPGAVRVAVPPPGGGHAPTA